MSIKSERSPDHSIVVLGACLGVGVVLALLVFILLGLTAWAAVLAALFLVCPAIIGWGLFHTTRRQPRLPAGDKPQ